MQNEFTVESWEIETRPPLHACTCSEYYFIWRINNPVYRVQYGEGDWEVNPGVFVHSIRRLWRHKGSFIWVPEVVMVFLGRSGITFIQVVCFLWINVKQTDVHMRKVNVQIVNACLAGSPNCWWIYPVHQNSWNNFISKIYIEFCLIFLYNLPT